MRAIFHSYNCFVGITLDTFDQRSDTLSRLGRAFSEETDFIGDNGESSTMLTRHSGLNSSIEREQVRLICDVFDDTDNFTDFIGALTEALDFLSGILDVFTNEDHAFDRLTNGTLAAIGVAQRFLRSLGAQLGIARYILNEDSQGFDGLGGLRNLRHLSFGSPGQLSGAINDTASGVRHLHRGYLNASDNFCKLLDHIVKRVGQDTERIWGDFGLDTQVAITNSTDFLKKFFNLSLQCSSIITIGVECDSTLRIALTIKEGIQVAGEHSELIVTVDRCTDGTIPAHIITTNIYKSK